MVFFASNFQMFVQAVNIASGKFPFYGEFCLKKPESICTFERVQTPVNTHMTCIVEHSMQKWEKDPGSENYKISVLSALPPCMIQSQADICWNRAVRVSHGVITSYNCMCAVLATDSSFSFGNYTTYVTVLCIPTGYHYISNTCKAFCFLMRCAVRRVISFCWACSVSLEY